MIAVLDTHIVLWWFDRSRRLTRAQTRMLARNDADHPLGVADISLWEIAALVEVGRVRLALPGREWLFFFVRLPPPRARARRPRRRGPAGHARNRERDHRARLDPGLGPRRPDHRRHRARARSAPGHVR